MKKFLSLLVAICSMNTAYADDAKIKIHIAGATADNRYFLCVSDAGCLSINDGNHGSTYPMDAGSNIHYIMTADTASKQLSNQTLPSSCQAAVGDNQTVTITGKLQVSGNTQAYVKDLNCSIQ